MTWFGGSVICGEDGEWLLYVTVYIAGLHDKVETWRYVGVIVVLLCWIVLVSMLTIVVLILSNFNVVGFHLFILNFHQLKQWQRNIKVLIFAASHRGCLGLRKSSWKKNRFSYLLSHLSQFQKFGYVLPACANETHDWKFGWEREGI